jgi:hypothetical protein
MTTQNYPVVCLGFHECPACLRSRLTSKAAAQYRPFFLSAAAGPYGPVLAFLNSVIPRRAAAAPYGTGLAFLNSVIPRP